MLRNNLWLALLSIVTFCISFGLGFVVGFSLRLLNTLGLRDHRDSRQKEESIELEIPADIDEGAVADSSPEHLFKKRDKRVRNGEDPIDQEESQIVNTKTPEQFQEEAEVAKNKRLDKWMPELKHDE